MIKFCLTCGKQFKGRTEALYCTYACHHVARRATKPGQIKRCSKCGGEGPFGKHKGSSDGLSTICKQCNVKHVAAWRKNNKEKRNSNARDYRQRNLERVRAKARVAVARYRVRNPSNYKACYKRWYQKKSETNIEYLRIRNASHQAKRKGASGYASLQQVTARVELFGNRCAYCGGPYEHLEHVIPLARGGTHWPANLRPSCAKCNYEKGVSLSREWWSLLGRARKTA